MEFDLLSIYQQATLVAKIVLAVLIMLSVASWAVLFQKWLSLRSADAKTRSGIKAFDEAESLRDAVTRLGGDASSPLYGIATLGVTEYNRSRGMGNPPEIVAENVERALRRGVTTAVGRLGGSLPFLATIANTAPFIGLFGTVWGIMHSFHAIGAMRSASLATVAPGISEALIATAFGLIVAIPATVGYNMFQSRLDRIDGLLRNFADVFLNRVRRETNAARSGKES